MAHQPPQPFLFRVLFALVGSKSSQKGKKHFILDKRRKFGIGVVILSVGLFLTEFAFNTYGVLIALFLACISDIILLWAIHEDIKKTVSVQVFILPFLYSLSFGLFSFLTPARLLTRIILTVLYAVGLYSVFLSENIFTIASLRTIPLVSSARIVSLIISLVTFFFLSSTTFSLRVSFIPTWIIFFVFCVLLSIHAIWSYTLNRDWKKDIVWIGVMVIVPIELGILLWFWPTSPVVTALFLTSIWYVIVGLVHVWLDKRLFKNVLWEYIWVTVIAVLMLIGFTRWQ